MILTKREIKELFQIRPFQFYEDIESRSKSTNDDDENLNVVVGDNQLKLTL
jgi:hypothetical protein